MNNLKNQNWHVAYTYPNAEKKINKLLIARRIDVFLPLQKVVRQWSDRKKKLEVPLFPNYIFVNVNEKERWNVLNVPGVVRFLSFEGKLSVVSDSEINTIRRVLDSDFDICVNEDFDLGDKVRITSGPLQGIEGILSEKKGESRFLIKLEKIDRIICLNVSADYLKKA